MTKPRSLLLAGMLSLAFLVEPFAQLHAAEYPHFFFAEEPVNPRKTSMGGAGAALDGGGFSFYNPASISLAASPFVGLEYGRQSGDLSKSLIETAWMFPSWFVGAAFPVHSTDWQRADETGVGAMSSNQMFGPTVAAGYRRGPFATGHALTWLSERIGDYTVNAVTYSTGITYRIMAGKLTAGASAYHYLRFDSARTPWTKIPRGWYRDAAGLPRMVRGGISWTDTLPGDVPATVAMDLLYRDFDSRLVVPLGVEAWILPSIAARAGKRLFDQRGDLFHVGCGIRWMSLTFDFDYAFDRPPVTGAALEPKWLFSLIYSIPSKTPVPAGITGVSAPDGLPVVEEVVPVTPPHAPVPASVRDSVPASIVVPDTGVISVPPESVPDDREPPSPFPADTLPADGSPDSAVPPLKQE